MKTKAELPERLEVSHGGLSHWIGDGETIERIRCYDSSGTADNELAKELVRRWNVHNELVDALVSVMDCIHETRGPVATKAVHKATVLLKTLETP